jgi:hypothetical protein
VPSPTDDRRSKDLPGWGLSEDEVEFMMAMERYKRENRRPFPTWHEVLAVLRALGYRKVVTQEREPRPHSE